MTPLREKLEQALAFDPRQNALKGIADANSWEVYATQVEPQPLGTPKYIFRTGHAIGSVAERSRTAALERALIAVAEAASEFKTARLASANEITFGSVLSARSKLFDALAELEGLL